MNQPRVFLADDHQMLLDAFEQMLSADFEIVGTARDGRELVQCAPAANPDVIVLDVRMPQLNGIEAARALAPVLPEANFVFLTVSEDPKVAIEALEVIKGASFLLKVGAGSELVHAIRYASRGQTYITPSMAQAVLEGMRLGSRSTGLTPRQREVLDLLVAGHSMKQIAATLGITARTVAHHKYTMMSTLGIESSAELIRYGTEIQPMSGRTAPRRSP